MPITTFCTPKVPRQLNELRLTRFGVYGEWTYANGNERDQHNGHLTVQEVLAVVEHTIKTHNLPEDHQICVEYRNAVTFASCMQEADYDRLLYSVTAVTTLVNLCQSNAVSIVSGVVTQPMMVH